MDYPQNSSSTTTKKRRGGGRRHKKLDGTDSSNKKRRNTLDEGKKLPPIFFISNGEILKMLVQSDYLGSEELKNLLLSKSNEDLRWIYSGSFGRGCATIAEDTLWQAIILSSCEDVEDARLLLTSTGLAAKDCATQILGLRKDETKAEKFELRPLLYSPSDYVVTVTLKGLGDKLICKSLRGNDIAEFLRSGEVTVSFDKPIHQVPEAREDPDGQMIPNIKLNSSVCIVRRRGIGDKQSRVLSLGKHEEELFVTVTEDGSCDYEWIDMNYGNAGPLESEYGQKLMRTFFPTVHHHCMDKISARVFLKWEKVNKGSAPRNMIQAVGITLTSHFVPCCDFCLDDYCFWDDEVSEFPFIKEGKVAFAHFLEARMDG